MEKCCGDREAILLKAAQMLLAAQIYTHSSVPGTSIEFREAKGALRLAVSLYDEPKEAS